MNLYVALILITLNLIMIGLIIVLIKRSKGRTIKNLQYPNLGKEDALKKVIEFYKSNGFTWDIQDNLILAHKKNKIGMGTTVFEVRLEDYESDCKLYGAFYLKTAFPLNEIILTPKIFTMGGVPKSRAFKLMNSLLDGLNTTNQ